MTDQANKDKAFLHATASLFRGRDGRKLIAGWAATARELDEIAERMDGIVELPMYRKLTP
jgi:hypothetical protein